MTRYADFILLLIVVLDLYVVASSRLKSCIRATALQGVALAVLPILLATEASVHVFLMSAGALLVKAFLIPFLLMRSLREANVRREIEPFISLHLSVLLAALVVAASFWMASALPLPHPAPTPLLVPIAFATLLIGFLVLVSRRKAITQVVGYLMLENGIFIFGQMLLREVPFVVELGILLDLLVGVFVMGIAIHHINREFDHIDTELLSSLKD